MDSLRRNLLVWLLPVLCGCTALAPVVKTEGVETSIPVPGKCIAKKDIPATPLFPLDVVELTNEKEALARYAHAAREELKVRRRYVAKVEEILKRCSD